MIPEIGHFALIVSLIVAGAQGLFPLFGAARGNTAWMVVGRSAARGQAAFLSIALVALAYSFVINDFSVTYVVQNSNTALPTYYRISALWGAHEGSMLLWVWILSLWTLAVTFFCRSLPTVLLARVLGVLGLVSFGFLAFTLATSNPFDRFASNMPMTEAGIDGSFTRDIYVSLGERLEGNAWSVRIYVKPFIRCIWLGAILIAAGGFLAAGDRRYRLIQRRAAVAPGRLSGAITGQ